MGAAYILILAKTATRNVRRSGLEGRVLFFIFLNIFFQIWTWCCTLPSLSAGYALYFGSGSGLLVWRMAGFGALRRPQLFQPAAGKTAVRPS